jgi:hypothetical protein
MILHGQVSQALHREGLHDSAFVLKIASKNLHNDHAVPPRQHQSREHLGQAPSQLLLCCPCRQLYELNFERLEPIGIRHGELFCRVSGTHADELVVMVHTVNEGMKQYRLPAYDLYDVVGTTDGTPIAAFQQIQEAPAIHENA